MSMDDQSLDDMTRNASALGEVLTDLETRSRAFGSVLSGALRQAASGSKSLEDILRGVGTRLADIALSVGLKPLEGLVGNAVSGLAGNLGSLFAFSRGGVPGRVTPFAEGGIVSAPTYFSMEGGHGLMGEAGAEAILPLKRGSDGALGVAAAAGGGTSIVFNITTPDAESFRRSEGQLSAMLARSVGKGQRNI
ncbi:MAG: phage tail protein [Rhizobiales bacterium 63-7]|nr:phage tail tape measure protein [Hyphomicrobiales bacterium]OJU71832.1 MAG: phage tail protein [Rhizobiales bacterium 63-7]